jgi:hypothetical protein
VFDAVIGIEGENTRAYLQASDVIVGKHRSVRRARRWLAEIHRSYPGCVVAVARHSRGRWHLLGLRAHTVVVRGRLDTATAARLGYYLWFDEEERQ